MKTRRTEFFDPETGAYGVSRGQPFTITVVSAGDEEW